MPNDFDPALQVAAALVLALKVAAVLGAAWLLARASRRASAAIRHGIWSLGLLAVLALPVVGTWVPPLHLELPAALELLPSPEAAPAQGEHVGAAGVPSVSGSADGRTQRVGPQPAPTGTPGEPASQAADGLPWPSILLFGWAGSAILRLAWLSLLSLRTARLTRDARSLRDERHVELAHSLATGLGIHRSVRVLRSPILSMPVAWGVLRPVVILPNAAVEWPEDRLRVVLLHELAHIRRWDYLTSLLAELACAVYWPVPLVWLARRRLKFEQEQACDDRVLATGTESVEYAEHLLAIARAFYRERADLGLAVAMAREISLKHRIRAILDTEVDRRPLRSGRGIGVAAILVSFVLTVAAARGAQPVAELDLEERLSTDAFVPQPILDLAPSRSDDLAPLFLWLEAEDGTFSETVRTDEGLEASGAAYLVFHPRGGELSAAATPEARADFTFQIERPGEYRVWARLRHNEDDAALLASLDGSVAVRWILEEDRGWGWREVQLDARVMTEGGSGVPLDAGTHALTLAAASGEVRIDRVLVTSDPTFTPVARGLAPEFRLMYQLLEAENAELAGRLRSPEDARASAGEYLVFASSRRDVPSGSARFSFNVNETGRYLVWGRVTSPDDDSNSLFVSINGAPELIWDVPDRDRDDAAWTWDPVSARADDDGGVVDPMIFELPAGLNILEFRTREEGVRLDALLVTNDLTRRPRGIWPQAIPTAPSNVHLELESALLEGALAIGEDPAAGGERFVRVDAVTRRPADPGEAGVARMTFDLREGGLFSLWARTISQNDDQDSFWVRLDGREWFRWSDVPRSESWEWSVVENSEDAGQILQFQLDPGRHVLEVAGREGGIRLDRLLLTNDPLHDPEPTQVQ